MRLNEAVKALEEGKKVRLKGWEANSYFKLLDGKVKYYQQATNYFDYDDDVLLTKGWYVVDDPETQYTFPDILYKLKEGKHFRLDGWPENDYIYYDQQMRDIAYKLMEIFPFVLNLESMILDNWEIVE